MARRHWDEVGVRKDDLPLEVDWERMAKMEARGEFTSIGAYVGDKLVGYNAFLLTKSLHYSMLHAMNDAIFVDPAYAGAGLGRKLVEGFEDHMAQVRFGLPFRVLYHVKLHLPPGRDLGRLLEKCGYTAFQTQYDKIVRP